jgi:hypothetical protein
MRAEMAEINVLPEVRHKAASRLACSAAVRAEGLEIPDRECGLSHVARYAECTCCGTLVQEPIPTLAERAEFYPPDDRSMVPSGAITRIRNSVRIKKLLKPARVNGPILDYGCGDGSFLLQAGERVPTVTFWGNEIASRPKTKVVAGGSTRSKSAGARPQVARPYAIFAPARFRSLFLAPTDFLNMERPTANQPYPAINSAKRPTNSQSTILNVPQTANTSASSL